MSTLLPAPLRAAIAGFAAHALWPRLTEFTLVDASGAFLEGARRLNVAVGMTALGGPKMVLAPLRSALDQLASADIVAMSYALIELPEGEIAALVRHVEAGPRASRFRRAWNAGRLPPDTAGPRGLIAAGANIIAPCPHRAPCPMQGPAWCHFSERLPRLRDHLRAKAARLPYEDEPYTYLALGRMPAERTPSARLVSSRAYA